MYLDNILVSVVTPTYKRSEFLPRAIDSILDQTHQNIEIILVNDNAPGSPEDIETRKKLEKYAGDQRVRCFATTGSTGGGKARNLGLTKCTGDYIAFLDDDDRFLPQKIEKQLAFMCENELDMSYQDIQWFDTNENLVEYRRHDRVKDFSISGLMRVHLQVSIAPTSIYMVKRAALNGVQGFGEVPRGQDFYFMVHCIQAGLKIGYMPGAYVVQYLHRGERISVGEEFLKNARAEFEDKKRLAKDILTPREKRFMEFRFQCICGFACMRGGKKIQALPFFCRALAIAPVSCVKEALRYFNRK